MLYCIRIQAVGCYRINSSNKSLNRTALSCAVLHRHTRCLILDRHRIEAVGYKHIDVQNKLTKKQSRFLQEVIMHDRIRIETIMPSLLALLRIAQGAFV